MRRALAASIVLLTVGLACIGYGRAQVMLMTGAGKGAPGGGAANVTADVVGTTKYQASSNSFNYNGLTITGGLTNSALVCAMIRGDVSNDTTTGLAMTWNGTSMTLRMSSSIFSGTIGIFLFGLRNPTSGAQTLAVSATNSAADNFVNCVSFSNVNQTSDVLAFPNPTSTAASATIAVTSASGHIAVGVFDGNSGTILGTTVMSNFVSGSLVNAAADYVVSSGASTPVGTSVVQSIIGGMDVSN